MKKMNRTGKRTLFIPKRNQHYPYGAYLLLFCLSTKVLLPPKFSGYLQPGYYGYAGNAWGSGGLRARCARHLRIKKIKHWHIDWLTCYANKLWVAAYPKENECRLFKQLSLLPGTSMPIKGFGNSDCKTCSSHLLKLPSNFSIKQFRQPSFFLT